ncbi:MAG: tetratricopeptide repeat-containing protein, partial [Nitrospinota bacterium]
MAGITMYRITPHNPAPLRYIISRQIFSLTAIFQGLIILHRKAIFYIFSYAGSGLQPEPEISPICVRILTGRDSICKIEPAGDEVSMMKKGQIGGIIIVLVLFLSLIFSQEVMGQEKLLDEAERLNQKVIELYGQGRYEEAISYAKRALEIVEKILGREHPDVATSLNNLAELYVSTGRYAEAEPLHKRSLAISEKALGREHPDVAKGLNNLALLYYSTGRYSEAEPLYKRSLEIDEKALGREHPDVATSLNNLALLY